METSPVLRRVIFGALVCALVGLGAYLIGPVAHRARAASTASPATSAPAAPAVSRSSAAPSSPGGGAKGGTTADIYQWLPFSQAGLAAAASVVVQFGNAYGSYSYTQTGAEYVAPLQAVTTGQLAGQIEQAFSAPGVAAARQRRRAGLGRHHDHRVDPGIRYQQHHLRRPSEPAADRFGRAERAEPRLRDHRDRQRNELAGQ